VEAVSAPHDRHPVNHKKGSDNMSHKDNRISHLASSQPRPELEAEPALRVQVRTEWLHRALGWARTAIAAQSPIKTRRAVRLDATHAQLTVSGFDYELDISATFGAKSGPLHTNGSAAVDAARLDAALGLVESESVEITAAAGAVSIMAPGSTVVLAAVPVGECPALVPEPASEPDFAVFLTGEVLAAAARAAAIAESTPGSRDRAAIRMSINGAVATVSAASRYAATIQEVEVPSVPDAVGGFDAVLPAAAVASLAKAFAAISGKWTARFAEGTSGRWLELAHGRLLCRVKISSTTVDDLETIQRHLDGPVEATATRTKKQLAAFARSSKGDRVQLSALVAAWSTDRTVERRRLRSVIATLPDGDVTLTLSEKGSLVLAGKDARTVVATSTSP
jgi:hypothetical protein